MNKWCHKIGPKVALGLLLAIPMGAQGNPVNKTVNVQSNTVKAAKKSQKTVENVADQTSQMLEEYRMILRQTESLKAYNDQMQVLVNSQEEEKASIATQIDEIELTSREVVPLMIEMLDTLEAFVGLDVPFLMEERNSRIAKLKANMNRANVSTSEKFRQIVEAYQVENEYGRTMEAYRGELGSGDQKKTVDFLKVGRIALVYQTLDGKESKAWDQKTRAWVPLEDSFRKSIQHGLKIARKQAPVDILTLPVAAPEVTR